MKKAGRFLLMVFCFVFSMPLVLSMLILVGIRIIIDYIVLGLSKALEYFFNGLADLLEFIIYKRKI